ncbi:protein translocase subunit SecF [Nitrospinae bacterium AH_259_B05_G02_I21]|nr:protein translocase subunit SecF [Nitrospinae bacterium AH_259_B05_G02_I21]MDA2932393.1 protein translocase subunit SecF [Nitrospinae bacterium AH-259-F20]
MEFVKPGITIDFIGRRRVALLASVALIVLGLATAGLRGLNLGIDFAGGTLVELKMPRPVNIEDVRRELRGIGMGDSTIQHYGSKNEILIRMMRSPTGIEGFQGQIIKALEVVYGQGAVELRRTEVVGPQVGAALRRQATLAIAYALVGILIYITIRFEFRFAVAAILALVHDVLITLGAFALTNKELSLPVIAAFLAIIGYSLNDTIVVFDRIRENLRLYRRESYEVVINRSINETLSRTILTSLTTLLVVLALFFLGGEVIHDFAFALLVGIIVGTYSSIFIASPLLILWQRFAPSKKRLAAGRASQ